VDVAGQSLHVPDGFTVNLFAEGLTGVRTLALAPSGAVYAAVSGNGEIVRLVDQDGDGFAEETQTILSGLDYPFGLAFRGDTLYFAEQSRVRRLNPGASTPVTIVAGLPTGGHGSRTIVFGPDNRLYLAMGSTCDVCDETSPLRAAVTRYNLDGSSPHTFATGLRNSVGLAFNPATGELWANNNDRDHLGDDVPPEHLNILRDGRWYGWPQCYLPGAANPEYAGADCSGVEPPAITFPAHAAPLGLVFYTGAMFPAEYQGDAFMTYHGSWNRTEPIEPKVVRVRVQNGRPTAIEDFVTGFEPAGGSRWGRPVSLLVMPDGALLVSDDQGGRIWRVSVGGGVSDPPPATGPGDLEVTTATSGANLPDSYWGVLDDGALEGTIGTNETVRVDGLDAGSHRVALQQVPANCMVAAPNPRTVTVTTGAVTGTTFTVTCTSASSSGGDLELTTATTGSDLPAGYRAVVDGATERAIGANDTVRVVGLVPGSHTVTLEEVAANCTVTAPNPRSVTVTAGTVTATTFAVSCASPTGGTGDLEVSTATTGSNLPDEFWGVLDDGALEGWLGANVTVRVDHLAVGDHHIVLQEVPANCTVTAPNPRTVTITSGGVTTTTFSVRCS
jgi:glucose/arabinose dehydrogenase